METGRGLPEVSLLLPLCEVLDITVNDLLTGETVSEARYREQAEENLLRLMQEAQENRRTMALSILMGSVTIVAMVALVLLAGLLPLPAWARAAVIALALVTAAAGVLARRCWSSAPAITSARTAERALCPRCPNTSRAITPSPAGGSPAPPAEGPACAATVCNGSARRFLRRQGV